MGLLSMLKKLKKSSKELRILLLGLDNAGEQTEGNRDWRQAQRLGGGGLALALALALHCTCRRTVGVCGCRSHAYAHAPARHLVQRGQGVQR